MEDSDVNNGLIHTLSRGFRFLCVTLSSIIRIPLIKDLGGVDGVVPTFIAEFLFHSVTVSPIIN